MRALLNQLFLDILLLREREKKNVLLLSVGSSFGFYTRLLITRKLILFSNEYQYKVLHFNNICRTFLFGSCNVVVNGKYVVNTHVFKTKLYILSLLITAIRAKVKKSENAKKLKILKNNCDIPPAFEMSPDILSNK